MIASATSIDHQPGTLSEYATDYGLLRDVKPSTQWQYVVAARVFERWAGRQVLLQELNELMVSEWLRHYAATAAPATVSSKRASLVALWRAAADDGLCHPPTRRIRAVRRSAPRPAVDAWSVEEVEQLLEAAGSLHRWHKSGQRRSDWWQLAIRVAWDTGLRWGDLVGLKVDEIDDVGRGTVTQAKTGRPVSIKLSAGTLSALQASLASCPRQLVCPWPASQNSFCDQVRILVRKARIRPGSWKWLRRSSGSYVERDYPGAGSAHLGHAPGSRIAPIHYFAPAIVRHRNVTPISLSSGVTKIIITETSPARNDMY